MRIYWLLSFTCYFADHRECVLISTLSMNLNLQLTKTILNFYKRPKIAYGNKLLCRERSKFKTWWSHTWFFSHTVFYVRFLFIVAYLNNSSVLTVVLSIAVFTVYLIQSLRNPRFSLSYCLINFFCIRNFNTVILERIE